jgi:hypothetical protein
MENAAKTIELVEKEIVPFLQFGKADVLEDPQERKRRAHDINRATVLGNGYHGKVEIYFQTADEEMKRVVTTIWDFDQNYITLKSGSSIPLRAINRIEFF